MDTEIPPAWEHVTFSALEGTLLVVGAPDTGKSTFARYLYRRLCEYHERVAFVDGDVGQATLGPPTTMTLVVRQQPGDAGFPPAGPRWRVFVGATSPRGHFLPTVIGAYRLTQKAQALGATVTIFDTTGLVDPFQGGGALKEAKVALLAPTVVLALQRTSELEYLLLPLRRSQRVRVIDLPVSRAATRREVPVRQAHRARQFRRYFADAGMLEVRWDRVAVFPRPDFRPGRLLALEDREGFTPALGLVLDADPTRSTAVIRTPATSLEGTDCIRLGDLTLDPVTFCEV